MIKVLLIAVTVLIFCVVTLFFLWRTSRAAEKETQRKLSAANKELADAIVYQAKLESTIEILKKNRSDADAKINNLHNGNSTNNALNELRKRKN